MARQKKSRHQHPDIIDWTSLEEIARKQPDYGLAPWPPDFESMDEEPEEPRPEELFEQFRWLIEITDTDKADLLNIFEEIRATGGSPEYVFQTGISSHLQFKALSMAWEKNEEQAQSLGPPRSDEPLEKNETRGLVQFRRALGENLRKEEGVPPHLTTRTEKHQKYPGGRFPQQGPYVWAPIILIVDHLVGCGFSKNRAYFLTSEVLGILANEFFATPPTPPRIKGIYLYRKRSL